MGGALTCSCPNTIVIRWCHIGVTNTQCPIIGQFEIRSVVGLLSKKRVQDWKFSFLFAIFLSFLFVPHEFGGSEIPILNVGDIYIFRSSSGKTGSTIGEFVVLLLILSLRGNGKITAGLIPGLFRRHYDHGRGSECHPGMGNILTSCLSQVESGRQEDLQSRRAWNYWMALLHGPDALIDWLMDCSVFRLIKMGNFHLFHVMSCLLCWK